MSRFDGEHFKNYKHDPSNPNSIPSNLLTVLEEDNNKNIWIGTDVRGIYILDKVKETFSTFNPIIKENDNILQAHILFIKKDQQGNIWYGGDNGVARWDEKTNQSENFNGYFQASNAFLQTTNGDTWIGDRNGLHSKIKGQDRFEKVNQKQSLGYVTDLLELPNGKIWIAASTKLWEFDPIKKSFEDLSLRPWLSNKFKPISFAKGNNGEIWLTNNIGILRYYPDKQVSVLYQNDPDDPLSLPPVTPEDILIDSFDNLFVNTGGFGLAMAHTQTNPFELVGDIEAMEYITLDDHRVLIRDFHQGGIIYDTKQQKITAEKLPIGPGSIFIPSLAIRGDTLLWIWNASNIQSYHLKTGELKTVPINPNHSLYVTVDREGKIWNGLSYLDESKGEWLNVYPQLQEAFPDLANLPFSYANIYFDNKNQLWGSINGDTQLFRYNLKTRAGKKYNVSGSQYEGSNGRFYVGTSIGLAVYNIEKDSFFYLTEKEGLLHASIRYIKDDKHGQSWISTDKGLQKYDWTTNTFSNYNIEDGFPIKGRKIVRQLEIDRDGNVYFNINLKKIARFHPDSLYLNQEQAEVHLLDFFLNLKPQLTGNQNSFLQKNLRYTSSIQLSYDQADFGFSFSMSSFYKSKQTEYFFRLLPLQQEWQNNGVNNSFHFTNISPGDYTFEVKAKSASGVWSKNHASVEVNISPPWWQTWWAYLLYFILIAGTIIGIWKYELKRRLAKTESKRLLELDNLKTRLYTNITHEFRTPLTVIMGMADNLPAERQERNLIRRNSKNLLRLINQLLDLSKLDSGSMKMDIVQGDIISYLRYLTESFYSMAQEKNINLVFEANTYQLIMDFDEVKIQHILYNLLSNALKFTPAEGKVHLLVEPKDKSGIIYLHIKVKDSGIGMSIKDQAHIFDRFYQADSSTTRKGEGTGIGLALTKELIEMMEGTIAVKSNLGEGTQFTILLPLKKAETTPRLNARFETTQASISEYVPAMDSTSAATADELAISPADKTQVLLIEDNKDVATYIQSLLHHKYHILLAKNGQEGIDLALKTIPDIIISDVMMPEKDGYEVCQTLKSDERTSHIPIILLTAKAQQKDKVTGLKYGADAYLMKPFDKEELFVRLEKLLELRKALQQKHSASIINISKPEKNLPPSLEEIFLQKISLAIDEHLNDSNLTNAILCKKLHLSNMQLYRKLKALTGKTPTLFIRSYRLQKSLELLKNTSLNISEIAYDVGFSDPAYFSRAFKEEFGKPPSDIRK